MKRTIQYLIAACCVALFCCNNAIGQTSKIYADTTLLGKRSASPGNELMIENSTKSVKGFLFNYDGAGRTKFRVGVDTLYSSGDTLLWRLTSSSSLLYKVISSSSKLFGVEDSVATAARYFNANGYDFQIESAGSLLSFSSAGTTRLTSFNGDHVAQTISYSNGSTGYSRLYAVNTNTSSSALVASNDNGDIEFNSSTGVFTFTGISNLSSPAYVFTANGISTSNLRRTSIADLITALGGTGEANTASNLGGGLDNFSSKSGVDLRFNSFTASDFNLGSNLISIDYTNGQAADASHKGFLTSTDWSTFNSKQTATLADGKFLVGNGSNVATAVTPTGDVTFDNTGAFAIGAGKVTNTMLAGSIANAKLLNSTISGIALGSNLTDLTIGTNLQLNSGSTYNGSVAKTISLQDAAADGSTKGAATFVASDFNSSSGSIRIDYDNGQIASSSDNGFLSFSDWNTFNNKADPDAVLYKSNNLSDLDDANDALTNLGANAIGKSILISANPSAVRFLRANADNSITWRSAAEILSDIGAQASGSYLTVSNNLSDVASAATSRTNLGATTIGANIFTLSNPSATGYIRVNADNTATHRSYSNVKVDLSLDNVENTALSTWAGSTNITTLGTIATGTWSATTIAVNKGGSGQTTANAALNAFLPTQTSNSGKVLTTDGTNTSWTTVSTAYWALTGTSTLTGATTITNNAASGLLFNGTFTQTAQNDYLLGVTGSVTGSATTTHMIQAVNIAPTVTAGANSQGVFAMTVDGSSLSAGGKSSTERAALRIVDNGTSIKGILFVRANTSGSGGFPYISTDGSDNLLFFSGNGQATFTSTSITATGFTTASGNFDGQVGSAATYNIYEGGGIQKISNGNTTSSLLFDGASTVYFRTAFAGNSAAYQSGGSTTAGNSYTNMLVGQTPFTTASSGTTALATSAVFIGPSITLTSGGTLTDASTVYIDGAPTTSGSGTLTNTATALLVKAGLSKFGGDISFAKPPITNAGTPSISAGTGAGTSPTISITGNDIAGRITLTTGTGPSASATIATITFSAALTGTPKAVIVLGSNSQTQTHGNRFFWDRSSSSSSSWVLAATATNLSASTAYEFTYLVIQ